MHGTRPAFGLIEFFRRRWRREVPLGLLFWRDMIVVGSLLNLIAAFAGLMALGFKAGPLIAALIFMAPLPYNIFLTVSVWRTSDHVGAAARSTARLGAALWLAVTAVV